MDNEKDNREKQDIFDQFDNSGYAVIHDNKVVGHAPSIAGAMGKAQKYGNTLDKRADMHLLDLTNRYIVNKFFTEPKSEIDKYGGLDEPAPSKTPITKSDEDDHPIFKTRIIEKGKDNIVGIKSADGKIFDIEKSEWIDHGEFDPDGTEERDVFPSDLGLLVFHEILDDDGIKALEKKGVNCKAAHTVKKLVDDITKKIQYLNGDE